MKDTLDKIIMICYISPMAILVFSIFTIFYYQIKEDDKNGTTINVDFASYVNEIEFELFKEKGKRLSKNI